MYTVKNIKEVEVTVHLTDHTRMWNDRIHRYLKPGEEITITDDQLSPQIEGMAKKKILCLTHIEETAPEQTKVSEPEPEVKQTYTSKLRRKSEAVTD
jgi:hypothetical protein